MHMIVSEAMMHCKHLKDVLNTTVGYIIMNTML